MSLGVFDSVDKPMERACRSEILGGKSRALMLNVTHLISPYESPLAAHEVEAVIFVVSYLVDLMHLVFNFIHDLIFKFLNLLVVLTSIII